MPDTFPRGEHYAVIDGRAADPLEDAHRWFGRAAKCERDGMTYRHCMDMADAALERAGMIVIGKISYLLREHGNG